MKNVCKFILDQNCFEVEWNDNSWSSSFNILQPCESSGVFIDGRIEFKKVDKDFVIPSKAVRTHYNNDRHEEEYQDEHSYLYLRPTFAVRLYPKENRAVLEYRQISEAVLEQSGHIFRWLLKRISFEKEWNYIPGEAVYFGANVFLVSGHPECGKVSFLSHVKASGGSLGAASVLTRSTGEFMLLPFGYAAKQTESEGLKSLWPSGGGKAAFKSRINGLLLVQEWENDDSECESLSKEEAFQFIASISRRSYEYCFDGLSKDGELRILKVLDNIQLFRFCLGKNSDLAAQAVKRLAILTAK